MAMDYIRRELYLQKIINRRHNGDVKIITGTRRSGKSWLLKKIYKDYLLKDGVPEDHIIILSFDSDDGDIDILDPKVLKQYLYSKIKDENEWYYVFLDEIQEVENFERIVNGLNARDNVDVYITGSNSKFLSNDIKTIFRGRGDEVRVYPLTFKEFCTYRTEPVSELWKEYYTYGGMPGLLSRNTPEEKVAYLQRLWQKTYIDDVVERNKIRNQHALECLVDHLCSAIGSLTNISKITNTLNSTQHVKISNDTIAAYLTYLENSFLIESAARYNVKGRKYYESIKKYYVVDVGLRNVRLNFRQQEIAHIMENVIYNELRVRGFLVDVGVVETRAMENGVSNFSQYEIDFVATNGMEKYYIQSAYSLPDKEKVDQELQSLRKVDDSFRKVVIVGDDIATYTNDDGFVFLGLFQFLKNTSILS